MLEDRQHLTAGSSGIVADLGGLIDLPWKPSASWIPNSQFRYIAQLGSSGEVLDQPSHLIPDVLVQTLSHPLRCCHNHYLQPVQRAVSVSVRTRSK